MQVNANLSAADVLAGNMAPNGTFQPCKGASVWGAPKARNGMSGTAASRVVAPSSKAPQQALASDSTETVATAAGALMGLQSENSRMSHKQVEQHRRLKAKQYFDELRCLVPGGTDSKNDRNRVLQLAIDHLKALSGQATSTPTIKEEPEKDEETRLSEDDTAGEQLMFEMDGVEGKKLSHNEVEQRRRLQAKLLYEELRQLLPNAAKFDKNTVLLSSIHLLKQKQGVTEEALSMMVEGLNSQESEGKECVRGVARVKSEGSKMEAVLPVTGQEWEGNSQSPCDVTTFADMFSGAAASKNRRKRMAPCEEISTSSNSEAPSAPSSARGEEGEDLWRKKSRASSPAGAADALALLSACATQVSEPNTPLSGPASCGASSLILALHPLSLNPGDSV